MRYGSRSNTKNRTVTIKGSVRYTLLTVRLKNGTETDAIAVKNVTVKNNGKRYGHGSGDKFGRTFVKYIDDQWSTKTNAIQFDNV